MPKQLTLSQKRSIVENLWDSGIHDVSQLHNITHVPSTLYKYIKKLLVAASLKPKSRPGKTKKTYCGKAHTHLGKLANFKIMC